MVWSNRNALLLSAGAIAGGGIVYYLHRTRKQRQWPATRSTLLRAIAAQSEAKHIPVTVVSSPSEWQHIEKKLLSCLRQHPFMGFDMEWVTPRGSKSPKPVSLMQLSLHNGWTVLIRVHLMPALPDALKDILSDSTIVKIGVGVFDDGRKLKADTGVPLRGALDLRHYVDAFRPAAKKRGLGGLAKAFLGVELDKDWRIRCSDWEAASLSPRQVEYAANDALVATNILLVITVEGLESTTNVESMRDLAKAAYGVAKKYYCVPYRQKGVSSSSSPSKKANSNKPLKDPTNKMSVRKSKLYHNAKLEAPDGQPLCTCDIAKANWYVSKGLGEVVNTGTAPGEAFTVRLTFEPSGRPGGAAGDYYLTVKENVCVVCGKGDSYLRKYVVPREYRTHFPEVMREHQSHDVLLMCVHCHQTSNLHDLDLRRALADECGAPIGTEEDVKVRENFDLKMVRSAARALLQQRRAEALGKTGKIPKERLVELEKTLRAHYGLEKEQELSEETLQKGANADTNIYNDSYCPHGKRVVEHFTRGEGILALEKRWRLHFLETMKPAHLPPLWSVDHQQERLDIRQAENRIDKGDYDVANGLRMGAGSLEDGDSADVENGSYETVENGSVESQAVENGSDEAVKSGSDDGSGKEDPDGSDESS